MTPARLPALPSRSLTNQTKPHKYTNAHSTNVAATFAKHERLRELRASWARSEHNPDNYPDDTACGEIDAAGTYIGDKA